MDDTNNSQEAVAAGATCLDLTDPTQHWMHKNHRDYAMYDEVMIKTDIRWKESYLSGDEFRISASVTWFSKGTKVMAATFRDAETALRFADAFFCFQVDDGKYRPPNHKDKCDQVGCAENATVWYELKNEYSRDGEIKAEKHWRTFRKFCDKHKHRGDCALEDADNNYIVLVERPDKAL